MYIENLICFLLMNPNKADIKQARKDRVGVCKGGGVEYKRLA